MTSSAEAAARAGWQRACARSEVEDGDRLEVELPDGTLVLLLGVEGKVVAVCADCPHQDTPLAEGTLDGRVLTCPVHFWQWDVTTGEPMGVAELPLARFETRLDGEDVMVRHGAAG